MTTRSALKLQQSSLGRIVPECWKLGPERAVTLLPDGAGVLRVSQGRVWATLAGPHQGPANDWGDVVLHSGEQLQLQSGQQVVVEVYGEAVNEAAFFSWEPSAPVAAVPHAGLVPWGDVLARPMLATDRVLLTLGRAFVRGLSRVPGLLQWLVRGRGQVLAPLECNQP